MIIRSRTALLTSAATALVLMAGLAGCTATGSADSPPSATATSSASSISDPLSEYLDSDPAKDAAREKRQEQIVDTCMAEQGFTYIPTEIPETAAAGSKTALTREWVEEHGTGDVELQLEIAANGGDDKALDPNYVAYENLPAAEKSAYDTALNGKSTEAMTQAEIDALTWKDRGCTGKAAHEVFPNYMKPRPPIIDDAQEFVASMTQGPEIAAIDADYDECMSDAGYTVTHEGQDSFVEPDHGSDSGTITEYLKAHPGGTADDPTIIAFKKAEVEQALADWDCREDTHFYKRYNATMADLEKDYIAKHKGELEEAKLWLSQ